MALFEIGRLSLTQFSQWTGSRGNVVKRGSFAPPLSPFPNFSLNGCLLLLARLRSNRWRDIYDQSKITVPLLAIFVSWGKGWGKKKIHVLYFSFSRSPMFSKRTKRNIEQRPCVGYCKHRPVFLPRTEYLEKAGPRLAGNFHRVHIYSCWVQSAH